MIAQQRGGGGISLETNPCQFIRLLSLEPSPKKRRNLMSINYLSLLLDEESLSPYVERNK
jgi:hypothetical protein